MYCDIQYLNLLIDEVNNIRENIKFQRLNKKIYSVTYLPTKNQGFIGIKLGYAEKILRNEKKIKEQAQIKSNCKNYLKIYKNDSQEIVQIEKYSNGILDCIFLGHYVNDIWYYIPFFKDGNFYPTYVYARRMQGEKVSLEYMVNSNQIIYENYENETENTIDYYYINYIKNGKYPVLEEKKGIIYKALCSIKIEEYYNWMKNKVIE